MQCQRVCQSYRKVWEWCRRLGAMCEGVKPMETNQHPLSLLPHTHDFAPTPPPGVGAIIISPLHLSSLGFAPSSHTLPHRFHTFSLYHTSLGPHLPSLPYLSTSLSLPPTPLSHCSHTSTQLPQPPTRLPCLNAPPLNFWLEVGTVNCSTTRYL